ncbi:MAG: flavin monoamine oxidase family protein [Thermodesulfobacteriota bacterium]
MSNGRLSRRRFLTAAGTAGAAVATPAIAASGLTAIAPTCRGGARGAAASADVVVVGAGFAGLAAARRLTSQGASVVVLEARARVGGRTLNAAIGGGKIVEVGGQWAGFSQTRLLELAAELGVETFPTYTTGDNLLYYRGELLPYDGSTAAALPPIPQDDLNEFLTVAFGELDPLAARIPLDRPWDADGIDTVALDSQTAETWKLAHFATDGARFLFDLAVEAVFAAEPRDLSLLHMLFYLHAGGGLTPLVSVKDGAQELRFVGGSQLVAVRMAEQLGSRVVLGAPVRRITDEGSGVVVDTDVGTWQAGAVVVALPPTLAARIEYAPALPALRDQLTQRFPMGSVIKCQAIYDAPFWRDGGLTGQVTSDTGPVKVTFDNSPPDGTPGVLLGFIEGEEARRWSARPGDERRAAVLDSFARYFGAAARDARDYVERDWSSDPWTRGCYAGILPPGALTSYGRAWRAPVGRIFWAGTETAEEWNGYIEGAIRSGERAADEVRET